MGRTCEPASIASQILEAAARLAAADPQPDAFERAVRRELERYTLGLCDYERGEVLHALAVQSRGRLR